MTRKGIDDLAAVRKDAADGDGEAQKRLGEVYFFQRDYGQAEAWLKKAASRNVPGAEDLLQRVDAFRSRRRVLMLKHVERAAGLGSPGDLELLHLAAEEDLGEAQQLLSEIYLSGKGVPRDWREAARWLSRAAKHKGSSAEGPLRQHLLQAARRNDPDDSDFLQGAAAEGVGEAQHVLKYIECKQGPQRDHGQAAKWLSRAAMCRGSRTRELLREELRHAADPSSPHGLEFLHGAAQEGVGEAQKLLGKKYLFGKGVRRDFRNAGKWLGRATRRKGSGAGSLLRQCLHRAAQRSGPAELDFLKGAAEEGVAKGQKLLGEKYLFGRGVPRNSREAIKWLELAASRNEPGAKDLLYRATFRFNPPIGPRPRRRREEGATAYRNDWNSHNRKR